MMLPGVVRHPGSLRGSSGDHGGEVRVTSIAETRVETMTVEVVVGQGWLGGASS